MKCADTCDCGACWCRGDNLNVLDHKSEKHAQHIAGDMMIEADAVAWAEEKGWKDGSVASAYSPPIRWGICPEADDAYISAYFNALGYDQPMQRRD